MNAHLQIKLERKLLIRAGLLARHKSTREVQREINRLVKRLLKTDPGMEAAARATAQMSLGLGAP